jgi:hypothetical protein
MPYSPECKMPDLTQLEMLSNRLVVQLLIGEPGITKKYSRYRKSYIRLIEKALLEYEQARQVILDQIKEANRPAKEMEKTGRYVNFFGFTNHIEDCINAIRRTYKLLERIKTEKVSPSIPREIRRLVESKSEDIAKLRNQVEHIDEIILKDELAPNRPIMLAITKNSDGVIISHYEIKFTDLAIILKNMHEIGEHILDLK